MTYKFKITEGCPKTGQEIACNVTQDATAFSTNKPSAEQRAKEGMAAHAAHREENAKWLAIQAEREAARRVPEAQKRMLRLDEVE